MLKFSNDEVLGCLIWFKLYFDVMVAYFDVLMALIMLLPNLLLWYGSVLYEMLQFDLLESFLLTITVITSFPATDRIIPSRIA